MNSSLEFLKKYFLRRTKGDFEGEFEDHPNPNIHNPPKPPDDIAPALQAQRVIPKKKEETETGLDCPHCGYKLPKGQKHCPICGKDVY